MIANLWAKVAACACLAILSAACISVSAVESHTQIKANPPMNSGFINKTLYEGKNARRYVVYVPREYDATKAWPLIVFLHGAGERGNDGLAQTDVGIGRAIRMHSDRFPCVVLMPQCPEGVWWDKSTNDIDASLEATLDDYNIDHARIYLTGLSMGGFCTWQYGAVHAGRFAALMPVCGGGNPLDAPQLAKVPIWAFHGAKDSVVPVQKSREMVEAVRNAGGKIDYTEFTDLDHNSWDATYNDPKAIEWLLKQRKGN
ncbi:MAG: dienelactone hydrolase family protein [FCB group bacterium]|jgi:predicted peptidase|nr:dienelactone hydrolase family protein [FCB group bacterium]